MENSEYNDFFKHNIKCMKCQKNIIVDLEDFVYNSNESEKENGMGLDVLYEIDTEKNFTCPHCNEKLRIHGWIREYPMLCYDSDNIKVEQIEE